MRPLKGARASASSHGGFSLVELLVVIVIIGILASIAITVYIAQQAKAYKAKAVADGQAVSIELLSAFSEYGSLGTVSAGIRQEENSRDLVVDPLSGAIGPSVSGPGTLVVRPLTKGTTVTGSVMPGSVRWCFTASNNGQVAIYDEHGLVVDATACTDGAAS